MNLLAKRGKWWLIAIVVIFWGCQEDLGIEVAPGQGRTQGTSVELTFPVSNVFYDSIRTDKTGVVLAGEYGDATFGNIKTESYFEYSFKGGLTNLDQVWILRTTEDNEGNSITYSDSLDDLDVDFATLRFRVNQILSQSSTPSQDLIVHTLTDSIYDRAVYLNTRSIETDVEIGRGTISTNLDEVQLLSDTVLAEVDISSREITAAYKNVVAEGVTNRELGLKISSENSNGIWSFLVNDDNTEIEITIRGNIYDTTGVASIKKDTTFTASFALSSTRHFTNVTRDRTGTPLENLQHGDEFQLNSNEAVYFPIAGVNPVISLQPFIDFAETEETFIANLGSVEIESVENQVGFPYVRQTRVFFGDRQDDKIKVNWPKALTSFGIFSTALLVDGSYAGSGGVVFYSMATDTLETSPVKIGFQGEFTAFWQNAYKAAIDNQNGVAQEDRAFPASEFANLENWVLNPSTTLDIGQNTIPNEGVTARIFYTRIKK